MLYFLSASLISKLLNKRSKSGIVISINFEEKSCHSKSTWYGQEVWLSDFLMDNMDFQWEHLAIKSMLRSLCIIGSPVEVKLKDLVLTTSRKRSSLKDTD